MIKIENYDVVGWEHAIRGMRNPMNSWEKSDSKVHTCECEQWPHNIKKSFDEVGPNDLNLMKRLRNAGTDHRKFMRMITVYVDITAPLYWWKEFDTYKVGTVVNSCSTMHKITEKEFVLDDFSHEHLGDKEKQILLTIVEAMNESRDAFVTWNEDYKHDKKDYWWQIIQLLSSSYNQKRTIMLNYEVLTNMYKSRKDHKLDEWRDFCKWIKTLPYSELITGEYDNGY